MNAVIFGVTGQDGSYLTELLLSKDYDVIGVVRRSSVNTLERLSDNLSNQKFTIVEGDLLDAGSINHILNKYQPDECYNLAAQSHVATSFEQPALTFQVNAVGVLNILEAIRNYSPHTKMYQASTSEMFGNNATIRVPRLEDVNNIVYKYQDEKTAFAPCSPYAVAKTAAHQLVQTYRDAYELHASSGILFNHETLTYGTPLIMKDYDGFIDILPIGDIARFHTGVKFDMDNPCYQEGRLSLLPPQVWDQNGWTTVKFVSGYPHLQGCNKQPRIINARNSVYSATGSHICIMEDGLEVPTSDLCVGQRIKNINYPDDIKIRNYHKINKGEGCSRRLDITLEHAELLGMLAGDGNLNKGNPRFTNKDISLKKRFETLWLLVGGKNARVKYKKSKSGFTGEEVGQIECYSDDKFTFDIYTEDISVFGHRNKKVPKCILNASIDIMEAFLIGYNACDGLKKNPCMYRFKNFKTNSPTLGAGLLYLISKVTNQKYNITVEESWKHGRQQFYYSINLLSDRQNSLDKYNQIIAIKKEEPKVSQREIHRRTGISRTFIRKVFNGYIPSNTHHLEKVNNEIKKIVDIPNYNGWFFDLETESGTFHAGIGQGLVHNSERRGENFVTRKITKWIGEFAKWNEDNIPTEFNGNFIGSTMRKSLTGIYTQFPKLKLGNLDARRDWGHAEDYVYAMWLMLQQVVPDDYVIATGETHSVREFLDIAFKHIDINDWSKYVTIDSRFYRPKDVEYLCGNANKAKERLGWKPKITFEDLIKRMVDYDKLNL
jgi:GDP-D-mannose dehydratase